MTLPAPSRTQNPRLPPLQHLFPHILALPRLSPRSRAVNLAIAPPLDLPMTLSQPFPTRLAREAIHMIFPLRLLLCCLLRRRLRLDIRPLNAQSTRRTQALIQIMIMVRAIRPVMHDIADRIERGAASVAGEALLVIPACQAIVSGFDGTATDFKAAAATLGLASAAGAGDQGGGRHETGFDLGWRG